MKFKVLVILSNLVEGLSPRKNECKSEIELIEDEATLQNIHELQEHFGISV